MFEIILNYFVAFPFKKNLYEKNNLDNLHCCSFVVCLQQ